MKAETEDNRLAGRDCVSSKELIGCKGSRGSEGRLVYEAEVMGYLETILRAGGVKG